MSEVEYAIADTQRFTGRGHIAQPNSQVRDRPVGLDIERDDRRAQGLGRRVEWRRLENQRAYVVVLLVACLIMPTAEWNPIACTLANRLRRAHRTSRQRCQCVSQPFISQEQPPGCYSR